MRSTIFIFGAWVAVTPAAMGQVSVPRGEPDAVTEAIRRFDSGAKKTKTNEVSVILDDVEPAPKPVTSPKPEEPKGPAKPAPEEKPAEATPHPVLVTGKPPEHAELIAEPEASPTPAKPEDPPTRKKTQGRQANRRYRRMLSTTRVARFLTWRASYSNI